MEEKKNRKQEAQWAAGTTSGAKTAGMAEAKETAKMEASLQSALRDEKQRYADIPVPAEAEKRVRAGIRQAEAETEAAAAHSDAAVGQSSAAKKHTAKPAGILRISRYLKRAGVTAAAALAIVTGLANINPVISNAMGRLPLIGPIAQIVTFRNFVQEEGGFEANVSVPAVSAAGGEQVAANAQIQQYAEKLIQQYEADLKASQGQGNYSLTSSYDVAFENSHYVCIRINTTLTMASGTQFVKVFTVDKTTGQTVSLRALCGNDEQKLEAISENIKTQMREQMAADENKQYFIDSDVPEYDFKGLTGEESYYFDQEGRLVVSFDEYTVAPGYMGAVSFTIPKEVTGNLAE